MILTLYFIFIFSRASKNKSYTFCHSFNLQILHNEGNKEWFPALHSLKTTQKQADCDISILLYANKSLTAEKNLQVFTSAEDNTRSIFHCLRVGKVIWSYLVGKKVQINLSVCFYCISVDFLG